MGPFFVVSQGNSGHRKQRATPLWRAQVAMAQKGFSLGRQPASPFGQSAADHAGTGFAGDAADGDLHEGDSG